jgi:hypothetical protein
MDEVPDSVFWCRKCLKFLPENNFYDAVDKGFIDSNGKLSVCKKCINLLYDELFQETQSLEKTLHRLCIALNISYSNQAASAVKTQIQTLLDSGKKVNSVFGPYKSKLVATNPSMDKSADVDLTYKDVGTIYTEKQIDTKKIPIPQELLSFWGSDVKENDIRFLENEYVELKATHKSDTRAEVLLLKQVCFCLLDIKNARFAGDDTSKLVTELQNLMKNLAISPNIANANTNSGKADASFGLWIEDIEQMEPAEWLKTDPRGQIYRDVTDTEEYFQKYIVRPTKNFITSSRDFNVDSDDVDEVSLPAEANIEYGIKDEDEKEG